MGFRPVQSLEATCASMPPTSMLSARCRRDVGEMSARCRRGVGEVLNAASRSTIPRWPRSLRFAPGGGRAHEHSGYTAEHHTPVRTSHAHAPLQTRAAARARALLGP